MMSTPKHELLVVCRLRQTVVELLLCIIVGATLHTSAQEKLPENVQRALQKEELTILITDSGLGGLSVCADIETLAEGKKAYKLLNLIFCNALPEANYGYNNLDSEEKKAKVFSDALSGMVRWYNPDLILVACNTLSVVYPHTEFSQISKVPVLGIVDMGAELLFKKMSEDTSSATVIFGTETTIQAGAHKTLLEKKGIASQRIITEACPELAGEIQNNPAGDMVNMMIEMFVSDAASQLPEMYKKKVYAGLCCTHYGYSKEAFTKAFHSSGVHGIEIVNPNETMSESIFLNTHSNKFTETGIAVTVASRAPLSREEIQAIGSLIEKQSPKTAAALKSYENKIDLFEFVRE